MFRYSERVGRLRRDLTEWVGATDADVLLSSVSSQGELLASLGSVLNSMPPGNGSGRAIRARPGRCAAAIITDVGAPLSHAAVVARELGIPAVVNCGDATMRLKTGDRVRVDGGQGVVEILEMDRVQ